MQYCKSQAKFLEHLFDCKGMRLIPTRIQAIQNLQPPNNKKRAIMVVMLCKLCKKFCPKTFRNNYLIRNVFKNVLSDSGP